jgi:hypothetical protein
LIDVPEKIRIGGYDFAVEEWNPAAAQASRKYGEFSSHELTIRLDTTVHSQKIFDTFFHEINHAIFWVYVIHDDDKEERICDVLSSAWLQIYRDNPELLKFIQKSMKEFYWK